MSENVPGAQTNSNGKAPEIKINDFVVRFANVNGTGSASANALFTKAIFRMGVPVTPKNIFPSNIQGLPTWYEVRVSEKGHLGRREGVDLMVAVNPQSMKKDYADVHAKAVIFFTTVLSRCRRATIAPTSRTSASR